MTRVLLYGDLDLNLIDGSAIWLASLAEVFGGIPGVSVSVLQKTRLTRDVVIESAKGLPNVRFLDPWLLAAHDSRINAALTYCSEGQLTPEFAAAFVAILDAMAPFDVFFVRSIEAALLLGEDPEIARRLWVYVTDPFREATPNGVAKLRQLAERANRLVCQTEEAKAALLSFLELNAAEKVFVLPPMIPAVTPAARPPLDPLAPRLGYSGKFSPPYMILEMLDAFEKIRARLPGAEFHFVGDKFHNTPPVTGFVETVTRRLSSTPGVIWHGGVSRAEANQILSRVDFASSWRASELDDSVELSTKVLEYSGLGIPVLLNPTPIQHRIFGPEYPGYVTTETEFIHRVLSLSASPAIYDRVSNAVQAMAGEFSFESHRRRLRPVLQNGEPRVEMNRPRPTILWVGHDFKFLQSIRNEIERTARYRSLIDAPEGHVIQHPERSHALLCQADLIFCEWCLGNAEWYSKHKESWQRLVVRLHRQEIELPYLDRIRWESVDRIIFITDWVMERFLAAFPFMRDRAVLIHNAIDCRSLAMEKLFGAEFNLGLLGYCPKLKAPHRAFDILARLKQIDRRYTLFIKGKAPSELDWLWNRSDERRYYGEFYARINESPYATSVVFEPHGDDVPTWLSKIGFILSTSDFEGSHQSVAEGLASGAIPVIRKWVGADNLYPSKYIFSDPREACDLVRRWNTLQNYEQETAFCRDFAARFDLDLIARQYLDLFAQLVPDVRPTAAAITTTNKGSCTPVPINALGAR